MPHVSRLGLYGGPRSAYAGFVAAATSAEIAGTLITSNLESNVVAGGETITITLTNDTWLAAGTGPIGSTANTQAIIDGLDSAQSEVTGWNNEVRDKEVVGAVARTSDTVATITLTASPLYDLTADETITVTVPAAALVSSSIDVTGAPTFDIEAVVVAAISRGGGVPRKKRKRQRPEYERRDEEKQALIRVIEQAYEELFEDPLTEEETQTVIKTVKPFTESRAKVRLPKPSAIDFGGLAQEMKAARELVRIVDRRRDDEEASVLMLLTGF